MTVYQRFRIRFDILLLNKLDYYMIIIILWRCWHGCRVCLRCSTPLRWAL